MRVCLERRGEWRGDRDSQRSSMRPSGEKGQPSQKNNAAVCQLADALDATQTHPQKTSVRMQQLKKSGDGTVLEEKQGVRPQKT